MSSPAFNFYTWHAAMQGQDWPKATAKIPQGQLFKPRGQLFPGSSIRPFATSWFWAHTVPIHTEVSSLHPLITIDIYVSNNVSFPMILHIFSVSSCLFDVSFSTHPVNNRLIIPHSSLTSISEGGILPLEGANLGGYRVNQQGNRHVRRCGEKVGRSVALYKLISNNHWMKWLEWLEWW